MDYHYGCIHFLLDSSLKQDLWRALKLTNAFKTTGNWKDGLVTHVKEDKDNYLCFFHTEQTCGIGYCGNNEFIDELKKNSVSVFDTMSCKDIEFGYFGFNNAPRPRFNYFEGALPPMMVGNNLYAPDAKHSWMANIFQANMFAENKIRNVFPVLILSDEQVEKLRDAEFNNFSSFSVCPTKFLERLVVTSAGQRDDFAKFLFCENMIVEDVAVNLDDFARIDFSKIIIPLFKT